MPFGLTNAPAMMQQYINSVLLPFLNKNYSVYLDNILIWSYNNHANHIRTVKKYFAYLQEISLFVNAEKYKFSVVYTLFLGHILIPKGLEIDPDKVKVILKWPIPKNLKKL